jgi:ATP-binding protein involved in chromosome partitioning
VQSGAIIVTTPQEVSLLEHQEGGRHGQVHESAGSRNRREHERSLLPSLKEIIDILSTGGGKKAAEELNLQFLGAIPLDPEVSSLGDSGIPFVDMSTRAQGRFEKIVDNLLERIRNDQKNQRRST